MYVLLFCLALSWAAPVESAEATTAQTSHTPSERMLVSPGQRAETRTLLPTAKERTLKESRFWYDVLSINFQSTFVRDPYLKMARTERDPFLFTVVPTTSPSISPTHRPTTSHPTATHTFTPTASPTEDAFPMNVPPSKPKKFYFDYSNNARGPNRWGEVEEAKETKYWSDFQQWIKPNLTQNMCNSGSNRQSPIDVRFDTAKAQCFEFHEIRNNAGEYPIDHPNVTKQILPSKLRFVYPREWKFAKTKFVNASWVTDNDSVRGPSADVPKRWGNQLPVTHVDIKIPSEHWLDGKQYAAEYQINLIQNREEKLRGAPIVSILFDIHPENKPNYNLQRMIDQFQLIFNADEAQCEDKRRKERRLGASADQSLRNRKEINAADDKEVSTLLDEPEEEEIKFQKNLRRIQSMNEMYKRWNPFALMTSIWFYGYEGSLTEPPCSEFVEWRIIDKPALISTHQLFQMKNILFNHVDGQCKRTSVHNSEHSVARPIQPHGNRSLYHCMCRDFISDRDRRVYGKNRCLWKERDRFGFDKDKYTLEWHKEVHPYVSIEEMWEATGTPIPDWA